MQSQDKKAPFGWVSLLSLAGIGFAGYLMYMHLGLMRGEFLGEALCGTGEGLFSCHAVTASKWGSVAGIPTALVGILGYIWLLGLALLGKQSEEWSRRSGSLIVLTAFLFVLVDVYLLYVMAFVIRYLCVFCIATYAINLLILLLAARYAGFSGSLKHSAQNLAALFAFQKHAAVALFWAVVFVGILGVGSVHVSAQYVRNGTLKSMQPRIDEYVKSQRRVEVSYENRPTKGRGTQVRLVEYSDFHCPVCRRAAKMNSIILANHRDKVSLVFKHYPLDDTCNSAMSHAVNSGSCRIAEAAACAGLQDKFWPFHDRVFAEEGRYPVTRINADAESVGIDMAAFQQCLDSGAGMAIVREDIQEANRINVRSTPTFVMNGVVVRGMLQPETFEYFMEAVK